MLKLEKVFHYFVLLGTIALIGFSVLFAYEAATRSMVQVEPHPKDFNQDERGQAKPLPEYIINKLPVEDLEILKP